MSAVYHDIGEGKLTVFLYIKYSFNESYRKLDTEGTLMWIPYYYFKAIFVQAEYLKK